MSVVVDSNSLYADIDDLHKIMDACKKVESDWEHLNFPEISNSLSDKLLSYYNGKYSDRYFDDAFDNIYCEFLSLESSIGYSISAIEKVDDDMKNYLDSLIDAIFEADLLDAFDNYDEYDILGDDVFESLDNSLADLINTEKDAFYDVALQYLDNAFDFTPEEIYYMLEGNQEAQSALIDSWGNVRNSLDLYRKLCDVKNLTSYIDLESDPEFSWYANYTLEYPENYDKLFNGEVRSLNELLDYNLIAASDAYVRKHDVHDEARRMALDEIKSDDKYSESDLDYLTNLYTGCLTEKYRDEFWGSLEYLGDQRIELNNVDDSGNVKTFVITLDMLKESDTYMTTEQRRRCSYIYGKSYSDARSANWNKSEHEIIRDAVIDSYGYLYDISGITSKTASSAYALSLIEMAESDDGNLPRLYAFDKTSYPELNFWNGACSIGADGKITPYRYHSDAMAWEYLLNEGDSCLDYKKKYPAAYNNLISSLSTGDLAFVESVSKLSELVPLDSRLAAVDPDIDYYAVKDDYRPAFRRNNSLTAIIPYVADVFQLGAAGVSGVLHLVDAVLDYGVTGFSYAMAVPSLLYEGGYCLLSGTSWDDCDHFSDDIICLGGEIASFDLDGSFNKAVEMLPFDHVCHDAFSADGAVYGITSSAAEECIYKLVGIYGSPAAEAGLRAGVKYSDTYEATAAAVPEGERNWKTYSLAAGYGLFSGAKSIGLSYIASASKARFGEKSWALLGVNAGRAGVDSSTNEIMDQMIANNGRVTDWAKVLKKGLTSSAGSVISDLSGALSGENSGPYIQDENGNRYAYCAGSDGKYYTYEQVMSGSVPDKVDLQWVSNNGMAMDYYQAIASGDQEKIDKFSEVNYDMGAADRVGRYSYSGSGAYTTGKSSKGVDLLGEGFSIFNDEFASGVKDIFPDTAKDIGKGILYNFTDGSEHSKDVISYSVDWSHSFVSGFQ